MKKYKNIYSRTIKKKIKFQRKKTISKGNQVKQKKTKKQRERCPAVPERASRKTQGKIDNL